MKPTVKPISGRQLSEEESADAYADMKRELSGRECAVIQSPASRPDEVYFCGKRIGIIDSDRYDARLGQQGGQRGFSRAPEGIFRSMRHALRVISEHAKQSNFWPNVYFVNERGNVDLLNTRTGQPICSWV